MPLRTERETFVIELNCDKAVGTGKESEKKVDTYMEVLATLLKSTKIRPTETHISPKYGLSGWSAFKKPDGNKEGSASHLYAWDHTNEPHPPFVSVDISTIQALDPQLQQEIITATVEHFEGKKDEIAYKTSTDPLASTWKELAEHITRQRVKIIGQLKEPVSKEEVSEYLKDLAPQLKMNRLSEPLIIYDEETGIGEAWVHWETSGVKLTWNNLTGVIDIDIYTCKEFALGYAIDFTRRKLDKILHSIVRDF